MHEEKTILIQATTKFRPTRRRRSWRWAKAAPIGLLLLQGCAGPAISHVATSAELAPVSRAYRDLLDLPEPKGKIVVAVYGLRDQTGQYKPSPDSSFSTAVTQGAASLLVKALNDSKWFIPVERENLQNLLTERKIVRALENPQDKTAPQIQLPALRPAKIIIEGGIVAYESNMRTGGLGGRYLGISVSGQYRVDQVTVNLRAIDVRSGQILGSTSTTKTIYSTQLNSGIFRFVGFKELLEAESGYTRNEPTQLCVQEAIEAAVAHLIVQGVRGNLWDLKNEKERDSAVFRAYADEFDRRISTIDARDLSRFDPDTGLLQ